MGGYDAGSAPVERMQTMFTLQSVMVRLNTEIIDSEDSTKRVKALRVLMTQPDVLREAKKDPQFRKEVGFIGKSKDYRVAALGWTNLENDEERLLQWYEACMDLIQRKNLGTKVETDVRM